MTSPSVAAMGQIAITGNVIPSIWMQKLTLANGKPNLPAIIILSDIVYWYRPSEQRDERTGRALPARQKFKADKLQMYYSAWAELYGFGKDQVRAACHFLEEKGLITIEYRTVEAGGQRLNNVTFFDIIPNAILKLTHEVEDKIAPPTVFHGDTLSCSTGIPSPVSRGEAIVFHGDTCTEITTKTTTERERKIAPVSFVEADDEFSPLPEKVWSIGERFILKACELWEKPIVEMDFKIELAIRQNGAWVDSRLDPSRNIGGNPGLFREFWANVLKRTAQLRPNYVVEHWEAYDRWLINTHETHRQTEG
jgi:hypothetical protein